MKSLTLLRRRCRVCGDIFADSVKKCPTDDAELAELKPGLELFGPYEFLDVLGEGGMGIVYKARHKVIGKVVAIKMLRPGRLTSDDMRRFQKEGQAVSRLHHPGIVEVHDLGLTAENLPFMVIDFIDGCSLKDLIEKHGALSLTTALEIANQIACAMTHAHAQGVIHRDLKSSNIMLVATGFDSYQVKIVDFGIAKIDHPELGAGHTLTTTGEIFGSPAYMSPEQARGEKVGAKTDIYSAGCIIFETLTGTTPFHGGTVFDVLVRHLNETPPTLEEASLGRKFPLSVSSLVQSMLDKEPSKRPADFATVAQALTIIQAGKFDVEESESKGIGSKIIQAVRARAPLAVVAGALLLTGVILACISFKTFAMTDIKIAHSDDIERIKQQVAAQLSKSSKGSKKDDNLMILPYDLGGPLKSAQTLIELSYKNEDGCASLGDIQLSDEVLNYLSTQRRLLGLSLVNNRIGDRLFDYIKDLPLHKLNLSGTNVTDKGLIVASHMITLDDLDLARINSGKRQVEKPLHGLTGTGLQALSALPRLKALRLADDWLTDEDLVCLPKFKRLSDLILAGCQHVTPKGIAYAGDIERLQMLGVDGIMVPLPVLTHMKNISQIRCVTLRGNQAVTPEDLPAFLKKASHLEVLDLGGTPINGKCVRDLSNCTELATLGLLHCSQLKKEDIDFLKKKLPGCHIDSDFEDGEQ